MEVPRENPSAGVSARNVNPAGNLAQLGLKFNESMAGFLAVGETDPQRGAERGRSENTPMRFDVPIHIDDLARPAICKAKRKSMTMLARSGP